MRVTGGLVLIGGSTASGKSALALALAERTGGAIVNADSVQLYRDLPILTARPPAAELARAEHHLYGILEAHEASSVAAWLARLRPVLAGLEAQRRPAILTGGTGLYFKALLEGLPAIPEIPPGLRAGLRADPAPAEALHARLARLDPLLAARLEPGDRQRILRGLEVVLATGRKLTDWQGDPPVRPPLPEPCVGIALLPPADLVLPRIERRLDAMLEQGVLAELAAFRARTGDRPTMLSWADGVAELGAHLDGRIDLAEARRLTVIKVRRYAKRQRTFFRGQLAGTLEPHPVAVGPDNLDALAAALLEGLRDAT